MKYLLLCFLCISVMCISLTPSTKKHCREKLTTFYYSKAQEEYQRKWAYAENKPYIEKFVNGVQYTDTAKFYFDAEVVAVLKWSEADFSRPRHMPLTLPPVRFI